MDKDIFDISIHTLCEEGDNIVSLIFYPIIIFQSTPSVKRVTNSKNSSGKPIRISIHTLCEEGDVNYFNVSQGHIDISIHTLCEEGDQDFLNCFYWQEISIHTLCEEGDFKPILHR